MTTQVLNPSETKYINSLMHDKGIQKLCTTCKRACAYSSRTAPTFTCRGWKGSVWITRNNYDQIIDVNTTRDQAGIELRKVQGINKKLIATITKEEVDFSYEL